MYTSLNVCQKYSRLIEAEEEEDVPAVDEEISYLFASRDFHNVQKYTTLQNKTFCNRNFDRNSKALYSIAMKYHRQAEDAILTDNSASNMTQAHNYILDLLTTHRHLKFRKDKAENSERIQGNVNFLMYMSSILKFTELPTSALQKLVSGLVNKHQDASIKAYFHLMLDVMWLFITIKADDDEGLNDLNEIVELLQQVHFVLYKCYEKLNKYFTVCACVKVFFLRTQLFCEETRVNFWKVFNSSMDCYDEEFSLFSLRFQAELQRYASNGKYIGPSCHRIQDNVEFFNRNWSLLMKNCLDSKVFRLLASIEELLTNLWLGQSKLDFYYLTWDYYNKRIEEVKDQRSFHQVSLLVNATEPTDRRWRGSSQDVHADGYLIFLRMLRKHLGRHPNHWHKFKGRIYTKFPTSRVQKLSEQGLHNLAALFFALADVNFEETTGKLLGLLKDLPTTGTSQLVQESWNIYIFLIKQHLDRSRSLEEIYKAFGPILEEASRDRNDFALVTLFASNLHRYFRCADVAFKQSLLISAWLENYLRSCAHGELIGVLNALSTIIDDVVASGTWCEYEKPFVRHVLTPLKRIVDVDQSIVGAVAGQIVAHAADQDDVVERFASAAASGAAMLAFFATLRRKSPFTSTARRERLAIKAWFLLAFVGVEDVAFTDDVRALLRAQYEDLDGDDDGSGLFERFLGVVDKHTLHDCLDEKFLAKHRTLRVYGNVALLFRACGALLYQPTASCKLQTCVELFLLPLDVLRGKAPPFLACVERTWHLHMLALWRLHDVHACAFLERTLKDLVGCYVPHFGDGAAALVRLRGECALLDFALATIAGRFLAPGVGALVVVDGLLRRLLDDDALVVLCARRLLPALFEAYMFGKHKPQAMAVIEVFARAGEGRREVRDAFATGFAAAMRRHVGFAADRFFPMCHVLAKCARDVVRSSLAMIKAEIRAFGRRSGQGDDVYLHTHWSNLEKACR